MRNIAMLKLALAAFLVVVESPDRKANERFVDELGGSLEAQVQKRAACAEAIPALAQSAATATTVARTRRLGMLARFTLSVSCYRVEII